MNKRINELACQANTELGLTFSPENVQKSHEYLQRFAELIIKEQLSLWHRMDNGNVTHGYTEMEDYPRAVLKHFGVE